MKTKTQIKKERELFCEKNRIDNEEPYRKIELRRNEIQNELKNRENWSRWLDVSTEGRTCNNAPWWKKFAILPHSMTLLSGEQRWFWGCTYFEVLVARYKLPHSHEWCEVICRELKDGTRGFTINWCVWTGP